MFIIIISYNKEKLLQTILQVIVYLIIIILEKKLINTNYGIYYDYLEKKGWGKW